jgi:hypothetical protein
MVSEDSGPNRQIETCRSGAQGYKTSGKNGTSGTSAGGRKGKPALLKVGDYRDWLVFVVAKVEKRPLSATPKSSIGRAAANGHTETVWTLLAAGADVRARNGAALRLAMIGGHSRTALFLSAWIREDGDQPA